MKPQHQQVTFRCFHCGKAICFDNYHVSKNGKKIPLTASTKRPHRCPARPFNKESRKRYWQQQQRDAETERAKRFREKYEEWLREEQKKKQQQKTIYEDYSYVEMQKKYRLVLGFDDLHQKINEEELKTAFRQKMLKYHPDRNSSPDAAERTREIIEAYDKINIRITLPSS